MSSRHLSSNVIAMIGQLQPIYSKAPQINERARLAQLRRLADRSDETLVVYKTSLKAMIAFLALASLSAGTGAIFAHDQNWMLACLFCGLSTMLALTAVIAFTRQNAPCLTLSPYGLVLPNMARPIPWTAITDYIIKACWTPLNPGGSHPNALILQLSHQYRVRGLRWPRVSSIYSPGKHQFHLFIGDHLRLDNGTSVEDVREFARFVEYFLTCWRAALAREELSQIDHNAIAPSSVREVCSRREPERGTPQDNSSPRLNSPAFAPDHQGPVAAQVQDLESLLKAINGADRDERRREDARQGSGAGFL